MKDKTAIEKKSLTKEYEKSGKNSAIIWFERYEIRELLGEGGTGKVYLAQDIRLGRSVAIKILRRVTEQFDKEVYLLQKQGLPMLPVIYDAWREEDGTGILVMEYVRGQNLKEFLALQGQPSEKQIFKWGLELGGFLQKLHSMQPRILYRDLKLENIMVQPDRSLRLVDVGAAVCVAENRFLERKRVGTYGYASPEQWEGKEIDERTDIYALGAVLHEMISSMRGSMTAVVRRCMKQDRRERYATAGAFLEAWKGYKRAGKWSSIKSRILKLAAYFMLLMAVRFIWGGILFDNMILHKYVSIESIITLSTYRERVMKAILCLGEYLALTMIKRIEERKEAGWEQEKSVWCRGNI